MENFDYLIVGGGSAGCVLAARLSEDPKVRVALLEAGPPDASVLIHCPAGLVGLAITGTANWRFETVPQPGLLGRRGYQPRGKVLGGSSSVNAMVYIRGVPADYDAWAAAGNSGWSYADVLPYFKRAEHNERGADEFHGTGGPLNVMDLRSAPDLRNAFVEAGVQAGWPHNPDFNGATQLGVGAYQATHRAGERCSAAKGYLAPALGRANLTVVTGAHTTRVITERTDTGTRATGVEFVLNNQRGAPRRFGVKAGGEVLLSAGAFGSPQLLMLSGIGAGAQLQAHGVSVVRDLPGVGANFHDHPDTVLVVEAPGARDSVGILPSQLPRYLRAAAQWRRERQGLLTSNFAEAGGFLKTAAEEALPDLQLHFIIGKLRDHGRKLSLGNGYSCHVCLLRPQSRGSVQLASADPFAAPLIDPAFLTHPDDVRRLIRGVRLSREILRQPALAQFGGQEVPASRGAQSDAEIEHFIRSTSDTVYHPVGSCRMGADGMAVVDAELRVHGVAGLRVVDASIMPSINGGNTNAPTIMIAEKASDLLRAARRQG
ncbi:MAG: hypothetical protein RJB26_1164 [Pseudomonadota bacterium]|jgi:choline dehydrogenase-like flavoprotein